jgi:hypothetical protein
MHGGYNPDSRVTVGSEIDARRSSTQDSVWAVRLGSTAQILLTRTGILILIWAVHSQISAQVAPSSSRLNADDNQWSRGGAPWLGDPPDGIWCAINRYARCQIKLGRRRIQGGGWYSQMAWRRGCPRSGAASRRTVKAGEQFRIEQSSIRPGEVTIQSHATWCGP